MPMVQRIMGVLDIIAGLWILLMNYDVGLPKIGAMLAGYLIIKGIIFRESIMSYIDIAVAVYVFFAILAGFNTVLAWVCMIYLVQKGIVSFF